MCPAFSAQTPSPKNLLFDLDGTLTDPYEGISRSVISALAAFGIPEPDRAALSAFIGPPLIDSFMEFYGFSRADAERAVKIYRAYFSDKGLFENEVYPGIPEALETLKRAGKKLYVATAKPEVFAGRILDRFGLSPFFEGLTGATLDGSRSRKDEVIRCALDAFSLPPADSVMIGDRKHDILGAKAHGLFSVGVLYGYGSRAELEAAGADRLAENPADLVNILR